MNIHVYMHYLKGGQFHSGVQLDDEVVYVRPDEPLSTTILAYFDVYLDDGVPRSISALHRVIDEAFVRIGIPSEAKLYSEKTSQGTLEFLYRPPYAKDASEVKAVMDKVLSLVQEDPSAKYRTLNS